MSMNIKKANEILSKYFVKENDFFLFNGLKFIFIDGYLICSGRTEFDFNGIKTTFNVNYTYLIKNENDLEFIINVWINTKNFVEKFKPDI